MTEKRYSFNWEREHPNFWDNHCDLADCYLTCEDVVDKLNELHETVEDLSAFKDKVFKVIDKKREWHLLQAKKCRNQGNIKKAIKFEEAIMTLDILRRDIQNE